MLKVGIAGIGFMGWIQWLAYQETPGVEVAAICTLEEDRRAGDWTDIKGNFGPPGKHVDLSGNLEQATIQFDYGDDYMAFSNAGLEGGFYKSENASVTATGGALIVLLSDDLEATQQKVEAAGGKIVKQIFSFPGGRRFQFTEPSGNEFGVWSMAQSD